MTFLLHIVHACNPRSQDMKAGGSHVEDYPWLCIEVEDNLLHETIF